MSAYWNAGSLSPALLNQASLGQKLSYLSLLTKGPQLNVYHMENVR